MKRFGLPVFDFLSLQKRIMAKFGRELVGFFVGMLAASIVFCLLVYAISPRRAVWQFETTATTVTAEFQPSLLPSITTTPQANNTPIPTMPITGLINVNTASLAELERLPGIGPTLAQRIIDARPYQSVPEIQKVSGIGTKRYQDIKDLIAVK